MYGSSRGGKKWSKNIPATVRPKIRAFFDGPANTVRYLVWYAATKVGAVIDPVLDYDFRSGKATSASADAILDAAQKLGVKIGKVLETHTHPDHLSGAPFIKLKTGAVLEQMVEFRAVAGCVGGVEQRAENALHIADMLADTDLGVAHEQARCALYAIRPAIPRPRPQRACARGRDGRRIRDGAADARR